MSDGGPSDGTWLSRAASASGSIPTPPAIGRKKRRRRFCFGLGVSHAQDAPRCDTSDPDCWVGAASVRTMAKADSTMS